MSTRSSISKVGRKSIYFFAILQLPLHLPTFQYAISVCSTSFLLSIRSHHESLKIRKDATLTCESVIWNPEFEALTCSIMLHYQGEFTFQVLCHALDAALQIIQPSSSTESSITYLASRIPLFWLILQGKFGCFRSRTLAPSRKSITSILQPFILQVFAFHSTPLQKFKVTQTNEQDQALINTRRELNGAHLVDGAASSIHLSHQGMQAMVRSELKSPYLYFRIPFSLLCAAARGLLVLPSPGFLWLQIRKFRN